MPCRSIQKMANTASTDLLSQLLQFSVQQQPEMLHTLQHIVEMESPSDNKAAVDKLGAHLGQEFEPWRQSHVPSGQGLRQPSASGVPRHFRSEAGHVAGTF